MKVLLAATLIIGAFAITSEAQNRRYPDRGLQTVYVGCGTRSAETKDGGREICYTGLSEVRDIYLDRQTSRAPCYRGDSYGIANRSGAIYVSRGCRGYFEVRGYR